jgi:hypothetical protein
VDLKAGKMSADQPAADPANVKSVVDASQAEIARNVIFGKSRIALL